MNKVFCSILFLLVAAISFAQVDWKLTAYYNAFQDTSQTLKFKPLGYYELNPVMRPFVNDGRMFVAASIAACSLLDSLARKSEWIYAAWAIVEGIVVWKNAKKPGLGNPPAIWVKIRV